MLKIEVKHSSKAKPAGAIFNGHITMDKNGYQKWKANLAFKLASQCNLRHISIYGLIIHHYVHSLKCGDLPNINGAAIDALTKKGANILRDDCPSILHHFAGAVVKVPKNEPERIVYYFCQSPDEFLRYSVPFEEFQLPKTKTKKTTKS